VRLLRLEQSCSTLSNRFGDSYSERGVNRLSILAWMCRASTLQRAWVALLCRAQPLAQVSFQCGHRHRHGWLRRHDWNYAFSYRVRETLPQGGSGDDASSTGLRGSGTATLLQLTTPAISTGSMPAELRTAAAARFGGGRQHVWLVAYRPLRRCAPC
jgi:hypothetical protein